MVCDAQCLIELDNVRVSYQDAEVEKVVLSDVRLQVRRGEFLTLVGPSGGGKSTILRLILGSQFPSAGAVLMDGKPVCQVERDRGIVYQAYSLFPHLTVSQNIAFGAVLANTSLRQRLLYTPGYFAARRKARAETKRLLGEIGLSQDDGKKYPQELSGGMRQRVAIAQALIAQPKVLLMDEPFGALDHAIRGDMQSLALEMWKQYGTTVLFVTHDLEEAVALGTRVIGISQYGQNGHGDPGAGAKVVIDQQIPGTHPKPASWKSTAEFQELVQALKNMMPSSRNMASP